MRVQYRFDTVELHFTGDAPSAGEIAAILHESVGLNAEAIASIRLLRQIIVIDLNARAARELLTPHTLRWSKGQGVLRRISDRPIQEPTYTVTVTKTFATVGELSNTLFSQAVIAGEDIGIVRQTADKTSFDVPVWRYRHKDLPHQIDGIPTTIEKKKPKRTATNSAPLDKPLDVLQSIVRQHAYSKSRLRKVAYELVSRSRYDSVLNRTVRRLSSSQWRLVETESTPSPWSTVLRFALAPSDEIERYRTRLRQVTFPTEHHLETEDLLELLVAERLGEPHAIEPIGAAIIELAQTAGLETRVLGTLAPGARGKGLTISGNTTQPDADDTQPDTDDIMSNWLRLAHAVACNSPSASTCLEAVDTYMRREGDLGAWEDLYALVQAEINGSATPLHTPLSVLEPQTDRYVEAVLAVIDNHIRCGELNEARSIALRSARERSDSSALLARALRLNGQVNPVTHDPVVLLLFGEQAWKNGQQELATSAFLSAKPRRGTLPAQHLARRLAWAGHLEEACELLDENSDESLRLNIELALDRIAEATMLWATSQGDRLGLLPPPKWAPVAVRTSLAPSLRALLEGELSLVSTADVPSIKSFLEALRTDPFAEWTRPEPHLDCSSALEAFLSTPDSHDALVSLANSSISLENARELVKQLVAEIPPERWEPSGVEVWDVLRRQGLNTRISISNERLMEWFRDMRPRYRTAAHLIVPHRHNKELLEAWSHTPQARLQRAQGAFMNGSTRESRRISTALLSRAVIPEVRLNAASILLELGDDETLATMLSPARSAELQFDILRAVHRSKVRGVGRKSIARALKLLANVSPAERIRNAATAILVKNSEK